MLTALSRSANNTDISGHLREPGKVDGHQRRHARLLGQAHAEEVARRVRAHLGHQVSGLRSRLVGDCEEGRYAANECTVSSNDVVVIDVAL